jgi:hypothetical protein
MTDVKAYADFISKQINEEATLTEGKEDKAVTAKVAKQNKIAPEDIDLNLTHIHTDGNHHTYWHGGSEPPDHGETQHYTTHDSSTGKSHKFTLPGDTVKAQHVMDKVPGISKKHASVIAREHNRAFSED